MTFDIHLDMPSQISPEQDGQVRYGADVGEVQAGYDPELDDVRSILADICSSLQDVPGVHLGMTVEEPMRLDVRTDLLTVLEQLAAVLSELHTGGPVNLDLYEQGVETRLSFSSQGDCIVIERHDLLGRPKPSWRTVLPHERVVGMLRQVARAFLDGARMRAPERTAHPWFVEWSGTLAKAMGLG